MKILIVDDESYICQGIKSILLAEENLKCQIETSLNSREALEFARHFHPDLVISDIRVQPINGLEFVKILKDENICQKVIMISGYSTFEYAHTALRYNVMDYLLKPIDKKYLLNLVYQVWESLPDTYSGAHIALPDIPYFQIELSRTDFPASLKKVIQYIQDNYMKDISLQILSDETMLHPGYISSLINKYLHISLTELLDHIRIKKACELLLLEDQITISEVSYLVGYSNERRLYNAFSKRLGMTPGDFRKQYYSTK